MKITSDEAADLFASDLVSRYDTLYGAFEIAAADPKRFQKENEKSNWASAFLKVARDNIQPPHVAIRGLLEIQDMAPNGVEHVRRALAAAEETDPESVTVQYVGAPRYRVVVEAGQYKQAEETLKRATEGAIRAIKETGGKGSFTRT